MPQGQPKENIQHSAKKHTSRSKIALSIMGLLLVLFVVKLVLLLAASPTISVDYVAEYNRISRPANYDPNDNADSYYKKAFESFVKQPKQLSSSDTANWPGDLPQEKQIVLQDWASANSNALEQLKLGTQKPYYWSEYEGESMFGVSMPPIANTRGLLCALCSRAKQEATEGDFKAAFSDLLICYRFGNHFTGPRPVIEQLIGIAIRDYAVQAGFEILDKAKTNLDLLKDFQQQLNLLSAEQSYIIDFTSEKLLVYDGIQRTFTDNGKGGGYVPEISARQMKDPPPALKFLFSNLTEQQKHGWEKLERRQTTELANEVFEYLNQARHKTPAQLHNEDKDIEKVVEEMTEDNPFLNTLMPVFGQPVHISFCSQANTNALITALALLRYKTDKDDFLATLQELVSTGYLEELPIDPYSDGALVYRRIDNDFTLYSVGADFDDDGGVRSNWGKGEEGGDQVFWPVDKKNVE